MSSYDDVAMDFGDDDDADNFLTGKLAALGIDEDLELSGGEEENEDPVGADAYLKHPSAPATGMVTPPAPGRSPANQDRGQSPAAQEDWGEAPPPLTSSAGNPAEASTPPRNEGGEGGGKEVAGREDIEDGELLEMLERPLQASRGRPQQHGSRRDSGGREGRKGRGGKGKPRGWTKSNNGRAHGRNVTIKECATWMCERLGEPKYYLMCRVVSTIGYRKTKALLERVQETQDAGGMPTADGSRKRTAGGVFFTLLKEHVEPAKLKELYADEVRVKKEKERARRAANKRKAEAALAGECMTPRDPPRQRRRDSGGSSSGGGGGGATRATRDMGTWAGLGAP
eukprot:g7510.t1